MSALGLKSLPPCMRPSPYDPEGSQAMHPVPRALPRALPRVRRASSVVCVRERAARAAACVAPSRR